MSSSMNAATRFLVDNPDDPYPTTTAVRRNHLRGGVPGVRRIRPPHRPGAPVGPLTELEIVSVCYLLYIGALDAVYSTLGWIFWRLAGDAEVQQRLRENAEDLTRATEEFLGASSAASTQRDVVSEITFNA